MLLRILVLITAIASTAACERAAGDVSACTDAVRVATLPAVLDEASGAALSRRHPHVLWIHNDSEGTPSLYAIGTDGAPIAEIELPGAGAQTDWEDIAAGPCPAGDCLYIGDIGDNRHDREDRAILRLPEPDPVSGIATGVERFPIRYPDGPQDAESLFLMPDTTVYIITKGRNGPVAVYRYPPPLRPGERVVLEPVQRLTDGIAQLGDLVTGADALPDGSAVIVRTYTHLQLYHTAGDTLAPVWTNRGFDLTPLAEPQGEGVAVAADGTVYLVSETGPSGQLAPLHRVRCAVR